jgi:hypothetical protein
VISIKKDVEAALAEVGLASLPAELLENLSYAAYSRVQLMTGEALAPRLSSEQLDELRRIYPADSSVSQAFLERVAPDYVAVVHKCWAAVLREIQDNVGNWRWLL